MEPQNNQAPHSPPILDSGEIIFRIRRGGVDTDVSVDLMSLKLTCEECEQTHNLQVVDGGYKATPEFLQDLSEKIEQLGVENCTPTIAWQMWLASFAAMCELKNALSGTPN